MFSLRAASRVSILLFLFSAGALAAVNDSYRLTISADEPKKLRIVADLTVPASATLAMAPQGGEQFPDRWARFVTGVSAAGKDGAQVEVEALGDAKWRLRAPAGSRVRFSYTVNLDHERHTWPGGIDGVAFARDWGVFYTGRTYLVLADAASNRPVDVSFDIPASWRVTAPWLRLSGRRNAFRASNAADLLESIFFAGTHKEFTIARDGFELIFALGGPGIAENEPKYRRLAKGSLDRYIALMGGIPNPPPRRKFARSVVVINNSKDLDGEVIGNHISMVLDPSDGRQTEVFSNFIFAHEFFHLWNGKSINVDSTREDWFKEGVTSYYTLKALVDMGAITRSESLGVVSDLFYKRYAADPSLGKESMRDVATSTRKDKHWGMIYGGGMFAGICQDVAIRRASANRRSLDDLMRSLFRRFGGSERVYTTDDVIREASRLSGKDQTTFFSRYVNGSERVPLEQCFGDAGLDARVENGELKLTERKDLSGAEAALLNSILSLK